jgi:hypothetical protein
MYRLGRERSRIAERSGTGRTAARQGESDTTNARTGVRAGPQRTTDGEASRRSVEGEATGGSFRNPATEASSTMSSNRHYGPADEEVTLPVIGIKWTMHMLMCMHI